MFHPVSLFSLAIIFYCVK